MVSINTNTNNTRSAITMTPRPCSPPRSPPIYMGPKTKLVNNRAILGNNAIVLNNNIINNSNNKNSRTPNSKPISHSRKRSCYSLDGSKVSSRLYDMSSSDSESSFLSLDDDDSSSELDHLKKVHGNKSPFLPKVITDKAIDMDADDISSSNNHNNNHRSFQSRRLSDKNHSNQSKQPPSNNTDNGFEGDDNDYINPNMLTKLNSMKTKSNNSRRRRSSLLSSNGYPSPNGLASRRRKSMVLQNDLTARKRCFDYLVDAIDEAWARYCDSTNDQYSYSQLPDSPLSITDDNGEYCGNYNEDYRQHDQDSHRLQELKERLINAKYFLESYIGDGHINNAISCHAQQDGNVSPLMVHSMSNKSFSVNFNASSVANINANNGNNDITSSLMFWRRWDLIKYAALELVEDNSDDDDIIESKIMELEEGRVFLSNE